MMTKIIVHIRLEPGVCMATEASHSTKTICAVSWLTVTVSFVAKLSANCSQMYR